MSYTPGPTGSKPPKTKISGYKQHQIQNYTPQQLQLFESSLGGLQPGVEGSYDYLSKLASGDEDTYSQIEKPAMRDFQKTLGQIGTRFSHLGAQDSNYFENATAGAGQELSENLQSQRMKIRNDAINSLLGQSNTLMEKRPFENAYEKKKGTWDWIREFIELYQNSGDSGDLDKLIKALTSAGVGGLF